MPTRFASPLTGVADSDPSGRSTAQVLYRRCHVVSLDTCFMLKHVVASLLSIMENVSSFALACMRRPTHDVAVLIAKMILHVSHYFVVMNGYIIGRIAVIHHAVMSMRRQLTGRSRLASKPHCAYMCMIPRCLQELPPLLDPALSWFRDGEA